MKRVNFHKRFPAILIAVVLLSSAVACGGNLRDREVPIPLKFALIGDTYPESAFSFSFSRLDQAVTAINTENPLILFHTGNMVQGGMDWMGINKRDMTKQFSEMKRTLGALRAIYYPVMGEKDLYNNSSSLFNGFSGRKTNYVVHYGNLSFVVIDRRDRSPEMTKKQLKELERKLKTCRDSAAVFVITHAPWFRVPLKWSRKQTAEIPPELHNLLKKYRVKACFSGTPRRFFRMEKDGILYAVTGCGGYHPEERYRKFNQFYIVDFDGQVCSITEKQIKLDFK